MVPPPETNGPFYSGFIPPDERVTRVTETKYTLCQSAKQDCPICSSRLHLLRHPAAKPDFLLCYICKYAEEVGRGCIPGYHEGQRNMTSLAASYNKMKRGES